MRRASIERNQTKTKSYRQSNKIACEKTVRSIQLANFTEKMPTLMGRLANICYILSTDTLGLHRVENPSHTDGAVSLHLYCPPYDSCSIFNQKTGKQTRCRVEFYSKFGQRRCKVTCDQIATNAHSFQLFHPFVSLFCGSFPFVGGNQSGRRQLKPTTMRIRFVQWLL